ncbi:MAG: amidohydrolase family protein [Candidatus Bathyarchaeota archaeon]|nr:amidohydrolase family protein [Candidatus Bathyarchaeota archaeon]
MLSRFKICDAHVHLGRSGPWQPYSKPTIFVEELINLFDQFNVERAIVFPNPNVGDKYPETNDYIAQCVNKYPDRLVGFGRVDPRRGKDAIDEVIRFKEKLALTGLKLHPMVECFRPDHLFFDKFFAKMTELRVPLLIHTGNGFSSPGLILKVAKKYPDLTIIFGHLREGCINALKQSENIYVETSGTLPEFIEISVDIDEDWVLFGSDVPYYRYPVQIAIVDAANISQKAKRKVYCENFQRLFTAT